MFLGELFDVAGKVVGATVGTVIGLSAAVVAPVLGITISMAQSAIDAGCTTYDEIRDFCDL